MSFHVIQIHLWAAFILNDSFSSAKLCMKAFSHLLQYHAILPQILPNNHSESSYHTLLVLGKQSRWNINITYYNVPNSNLDFLPLIPNSKAPQTPTS